MSRLIGVINGPDMKKKRTILLRLFKFTDNHESGGILVYKENKL